MSSPSLSRRPQMQRLGLVGIGAAVLLVGITPPAGAATDVTIPLEPAEVALDAFPVENVGAMDPMADPATGPVVTPVLVQYSGTITVDLPAELDDSAVEAALTFDDDGDGTPDVVYASNPTGAELPLTISGAGTGSITVTLPADDSVGVDAASLFLEPLTSTLGPAFTYYDPVFYELAFDPSALPAENVAPELVAVSQVPCALSSATSCPVPVTAGSTVTLDLTAASVLRELDLTDLTGVLVGLQALDANGDATGAAVPLTVQVSGSTATFVLPADTTAGSYGLVVAQQTPSGGISIVAVELTVAAEAVVAPPTAPPTAAPVVNDGLRSNTGVEAVEAGSTGILAVAAGAGLLVAAGVGGVTAARTRRRAAVGGTCAD
ncbi:hypothetical protein [Blastococcus saxobsidens]|uniref:Uncharacterized protein n=1 Tax=Blastococcus saxobsidens (strain DD2) TaxID=1146883 RepID=H6RIS4_BLASD|nr:hypothetical protein [Blastococcus saxobsidens]CCG02268.1 conserved exported protein of unknown function [Blastococcus saxobsidens DD2]